MKKFKKLKIVQIPASFLLDGTISALEGRETHVDTNPEVGDRIYCSDVFDTILKENEETPDCSSFNLSDMVDIEIWGLSVNKQIKKSDYVMIIQH